MDNNIYLDNNATTMTDPKVLEEMIPYFCDKFGNPSSIYKMAHTAHNAREKSREVLSEFMGAAEPKEIYFTSCGSESANMAIKGVLSANKNKKHIITTKVEHPCVLNLYKELEKEGYITDYITVDDNGELNIDELKEKVNKDTALVSIMAANNETGAIYPYEEAAEIVKSINKDTCFFVDAVQAARLGGVALQPGGDGGIQIGDDAVCIADIVVQIGDLRLFAHARDQAHLDVGGFKAVQRLALRPGAIHQRLVHACFGPIARVGRARHGDHEGRQPGAIGVQRGA